MIGVTSDMAHRKQTVGGVMACANHMETRKAGPRRRILHVEVGGQYGGSTRALELYLRYCDQSLFEHDLLLYYPTGGIEHVRPFVERIHVLCDASSAQTTPVARSDRQRRLSCLLKRIGLASVLLQLWAVCRILIDAPTVWRLMRVLRRGNYDVVHVNNTFCYQPLTLFAAWLTRTPAISHVRNPVPPEVLSRILMRLSRCVVTVNSSFERQLRAWRLPVPVQVCRDGVLLRAPDIDLSSRLRKQLVPAGGILVGSVGRLDEQKGYDVLIRAARLVVNEQPNVCFAIAGEGPLRGELSRLIADLGLNGNVQLCGFRQDVENFLHALDLFVLSSNWEGLPLALLEAMMLEKPVVATDVGGNAEVVQPGITGELVPRGDPDALAMSILAAIRNRSRLVDGTRAARPDLAAATDPQLTATAFDELVRHALFAAAL